MRNETTLKWTAGEADDVNDDRLIGHHIRAIDLGASRLTL